MDQFQQTIQSLEAQAIAMDCVARNVFSKFRFAERDNAVSARPRDFGPAAGPSQDFRSASNDSGAHAGEPGSLGGGPNTLTSSSVDSASRRALSKHVDVSTLSQMDKVRCPVL